MTAARELADLRARFADAIDRCDRPIDVAHDLADGELVSRPCQPIAALRPAPALHETAPLELVQDHFQEPDRDLLLLSDLGDLQRLGTLVIGQRIYSPHTIV